MNEAEAVKTGDSFYENANGWTVWYESKKFEAKEKDENDVLFLYTGEAAGDNYVEIRFIPDKQPQEVLSAELEQLAEDTGVDPEAIIRNEGFFYEDKWAFTATAMYSDEEREVTASFQSAEYNGGVILTKIVEGMTDENILEGYMDEMLWDIPDSISFYHYEPQTEYSYVPGTYTRVGSDGDAGDRIILKKDHTGWLEFQDRIPVFWGSWQITIQNSEDTYEYTIEGDSLYLKENDEWIQFDKTAGPDEASEENPLLDQDYVDALNREIELLYHDTGGETGRIHKMQAFVLELALHAKTRNPDFQVKPRTLFIWPIMTEKWRKANRNI